MDGKKEGGRKDRKDVKQGDGEVGVGGGERRQRSAIGQTMQTYPPPSNLRYTVYFLSPFRHRDKREEGGDVVGQLLRHISPTPIVQ